METPEEIQRTEINETLKKYRLCSTPITYAYHVTNQSNEPDMDELQERPCWEKLECTKAQSSYDGPLYGEECVFFSTTLVDRDLPTMSPYPLDGDVDREYWRVKVPINYFDDHKIWFCNQKMTPAGGNQVLLVMTHGHQEESFMLQLAKDHPYNGITKDPETVNRHLYRVRDPNSGKFVYYCNDYSVEKKFVNIAVLHDVLLTGWDTVAKMAT